MKSNLLILGAGGHGLVVEEVARSMNCYMEIAFLDDNNPDASGRLADYQQFAEHFDQAFVGIGDNYLREEWIMKLCKAGYKIPTLIHPSAYVSPSAKIDGGTIVEPLAVVNANALIEFGCIISVGSIVDHNALIRRCAHVNAGAICKAGSIIERCVKLEAGEIIMGYK
ncbi:MAG: hypothetical protein VB012_01540 [Erysipelotrichaceae bacterium]|nr:hypothetical protein [Erysipelotrichaceae bacterium]